MATKFISFRSDERGLKEEQVCRWIDENPDVIIKGMTNLSYEIIVFYQRPESAPQDPQKDSLRQDDFFQPFDWNKWVPNYKWVPNHEHMKVWCGDVLDYPLTVTCFYQ